MVIDSWKKIKYKYLGKVGSEVYIDVVEKMIWRDIIDELERVIYFF